MKINEIAFTGYPVTDMSRARAFYEGVLGLEPSMVGGNEDRGYWVEYEVLGQAFSISNVAPDWKPASGGGTIAFEVEDFDAAIAYIKARGVSITFGPIDTPVCRMVGIADPDGSPITLHKRKTPGEIEHSD